MVSDELVQACRRCVEAFSAEEDDAALVAATDLLRQPMAEAVRWLGGAALVLARDLNSDELASLTSRRLPEPGVVHATILALRDHGVLVKEAGQDPVELVLRLAATVSALLEPG